MEKRVKVSLIMMLFVFSVCTTAKVSSDMTRIELENSWSVQTSSESEVTPMDTLQQFKTERAQLRQMQKSQLNDIIYAAESDAGLIQSAQNQLLEILEAERMELAVEGILQIRGFSRTVATISGESISLLVETETLTPQETAIILDLIATETGISPGNVKIIPIK